MSVQTIDIPQRSAPAHAPPTRPPRPAMLPPLNAGDHLSRAENEVQPDILLRLDAASERFPGFWLQALALWEGDLAAMLATLQQGLASPEHAAWGSQLTNSTTVGG